MVFAFTVPAVTAGTVAAQHNIERSHHRCAPRLAWHWTWATLCSLLPVCVIYAGPRQHAGSCISSNRRGIRNATVTHRSCRVRPCLGGRRVSQRGDGVPVALTLKRGKLGPAPPARQPAASHLGIHPLARPGFLHLRTSKRRTIDSTTSSLQLWRAGSPSERCVYVVPMEL